MTEKVVKLENFTSDHTVLGSTEVETSVSVLVTAVEEVAENVTVSNRMINNPYLVFIVEHSIF